MCLSYRIPRRWVCQLVMTIGISIGFLNVSLGQGGPEVLNMKSGLQYEGELASASAIVEGASIYSVYNSQQIVVVADGLKKTFVSANRVANLGDSSRNEIEIPILQRPYPGSSGSGNIINVGPFDKYGHRRLVVTDGRSPDPLVYVQGITRITPRYCEVQTLVGAEKKPLQWTMSIATGSVPAAVLRRLLRTQIGDPNNPLEHLKIAEFFLQAKRFGQALEELQLIQNKFPDLAERIQADRLAVRQAYARQILGEVRLRMEAGQPQLALGLAGAFGKDDLAGEILAQFNEIQTENVESNRHLDATRAKIMTLVQDVAGLEEQQSRAAERLEGELESDLNAGNARRLDACLRFVDDTAMSAQSKLALAISGWLLGSNKAIDNLAVAQDMFRVRDLVREYLVSRATVDRSRILRLLAEFESGTPKYVAPLIRQMLPLLPPDLRQYTGEEAIEFDVEIPGPAVAPQPQRFNCLVHLPPEYDPYRRYPLLVVLPGGSQTPKQHLDMWCGPYNPKLETRVGYASRNGYIVMAVNWRREGQSGYTYSGREHATVMKAVRESLRMFSIDSDRVFLSGHGMGGDAAYDIGLSHPEHWAGVLSVSGKVAKYSKLYRKNKHVGLPVYSVVGSKDYPTISANGKAWNAWLPSRHLLDCTVVMYNGRGNELFPENVPDAFKWMSAQTRRWPDKSGFSFECRTLRPWDCYFWFVEFNGISVDNVIWPKAWRESNIPRMKIEGQLKSGVPNSFRIGPASPKMTHGATLWLSPEFVDFDKVIQIKGLGSDFKGYAKPSTEILLEDVRRRADREHPYWGRIDLQGFDWSPRE